MSQRAHDHAAVLGSPGHHIGASWCAGHGAALTDVDPTTGDGLWSGATATAAQVSEAVGAATAAFPAWRRRGADERLRLLERYAALLQRDRAALAELIALETGKPRWECDTEVGAMIAKVGVTRRAWAERCAERRIAPGVADVVGLRRVKAHGPMAVFGPFNLPGHLPNGHMVPALLGGNTVVLKPSEQTPLIAVAMVQRLLEAGVPPGVVQLVQGARETGEALVAHPDIRGVCFTGSSAVGRAIHRALAGRTEVICALEMGGNNPLVLWPQPDWTDDSYRDAALHVAISAFITGGQRCTCARRLILPEGPAGDRALDGLLGLARGLRLGPWHADPPPLYGALIHRGAAEATVSAAAAMVAAGGRTLLEPTLRPELAHAAVSPGVVEVTGVDLPDAEVFGPLLRVLRVADLDAAIAVANDTVYGLSAALLGGDQRDFDRFWSEVDAGICNWNRPTTGALSALPFGGAGHSGNHRPAGWTSVDYCTWPVASTVRPALARPASVPPGISDPALEEPT